MAKFSVPASPALHNDHIDTFYGVDFASGQASVDRKRSPDAKNIISNTSGDPVKRTGYKTVNRFIGKINGIFFYKTVEREAVLVHAGTKLYSAQYGADGLTDVTEIYTDMNNARSDAFQKENRLYILDGKTYLCYGEFDDAMACKPVTEIATVPVCKISMNPNGTGGAARDDVNVLTTMRTYSFFGTADAKAYHLSPDDDQKVDSDSVSVKVLSSAGEWVDKTDFTVDYTKGIVTFQTAPGVSPAKENGIDNVQITFSAESEYAPSLINECTIGIMYGVNGSANRLFVSGNPKAPNFMYWCSLDTDVASPNFGQGDPCNFGGKNYMFMGQEATAVMGFNISNDVLIVHKEESDREQNLFTVTGKYDESSKEEMFAISGSITGVGAISKHAFSRLDTEPLFLSKHGVYAITSQMLTLEKYAQVRSWYVNPKLIQEPNLEDAVSIEYNNYYYLATSTGDVYVADGRQKAYEKNAPQSTFQYEWYFLTDVPVRVWWKHDDYLFFGTNDGRICRFFKPDEDSAENPIYWDDGDKPIEAYWKTPYFNHGTIANNKTLKGAWVETVPFRRSSMSIYYRYRGALSMVKNTTLDIFDFFNIDFERFTFITDDSPFIIATNRKAKKYVNIQFVFANNVGGEGFGFSGFEVTYNLTGKFKG